MLIPVILVAVLIVWLGLLVRRRLLPYQRPELNHVELKDPMEFKFPAAIVDLESKIRYALHTGSEKELVSLGAGEVSRVLLLELPQGKYAVKRLAAQFPSLDAVAQYWREEKIYMAELTRRNVPVVPTWICGVIDSGGFVAVHLIQELLDPKLLLNKFLRTATPKQTRQAFEMIGEYVDRVLVDGKFCLDSQVSNWVVQLDKTNETIVGLTYLDTSTGMMKGKDGKFTIDLSIFCVTLPYPLRWLIKTFVLEEMVNRFFVMRETLKDVSGNLFKDKLDRLIPISLEIFNAKLMKSLHKNNNHTNGNANGLREKPLTLEEVVKYYKDDARDMTIIQMLRQIDKFVQEWLFGKTYAFLLPTNLQR